MKRRGLLKFLSLAAILAPLKAVPMSQVLDLDEGSALAMIGEEYLRDYPREADLELLYSVLRRDAAIPIRSEERNGIHGLLAAAARASRADMESGNVWYLKGWLLSRSEGRFCAIAALRARAGRS